MIEMFYLMKTEWKKVRVPVLMITLLLTAVSCILTCTLDKSYRLGVRVGLLEMRTGFPGKSELHFSPCCFPYLW